MHSKKTTSKPRRGKREDKHETRSASYQRRLKAAGIDNEPVPQAQDAFRYHLARRLAMILNTWHGCPELICARNRGCMAPHNRCTNAPVRPAEEVEKRWQAKKHVLLKALKASIARIAEEGPTHE